ncbi:MAG TPA: exodeoxyribonuclease VII large subunit [Dermatophilaceae bacterium]|nr:exodeoxyribonuclease VII large subunit [Dermatophilaceae bacterium]
MRLLSMRIGEYVERMSVIWVEGQVVQLTRRPGARTAYLTLRDPDVDMSLSVAVSVHALDAMPVELGQGARVVVQAKPVFWTQRGSLLLDGRQIRPVGVGELLARLEYLKRHLASEGLFDAERKRPLPFLPRRVGLVCGRASAAERDVVENARRRWPAVRFEVRQVAVQGATAVSEVVAALADLDAHPEVDVVVVARGGGSVEDLLPFSNETLLRAVAGARTPVVSAIGHDVDTPLLDLVADHRASTPTDAAKAVVPDAAAELQGVSAARERARRAVVGRLHAERRRLVDLRSRPVLADPGAYVRTQREVVATLRRRTHGRTEARVHRARDHVDHLRAQLRTLSPQSTLDRGYAIVSHADGRVVRDPVELQPSELLRVLVAGGDFGVRTVGADAATADAATADEATADAPTADAPTADGAGA